MPKTLYTALAFTIAGCGVGSAATEHAPSDATRPIVMAANGCGPRMFRTIEGECVPSRVVVRGVRGVRALPPCPRGYLRDPDPARPLCYPVY